MNDAHAEIRKALEAGPTPGPWKAVRNEVHVGKRRICAYVNSGASLGIGPDYERSSANARLIAACNPEAIRALLAERDAMERNRDMWKEQCHRQARELEAMHMAMRANIDVLSLEAIDSAIAAPGAGKEGADGKA